MSQVESGIDPASPEPMEETGPVGRSWRDLAVAAVLLVVATAAPLWRQSGTPSWQTVWAEDGSIYAQQAITSGPLHVLFRGYAGYLQLPPRLLAIPTTWMSIRELALYCALASVVVSSLLALFVYRMTGGWISSRPVRVVLASFVVLTPSLGPENTACIVNTIWVFAAVAPWALIARREGRGDTVWRAVVAFLAAVSTPLCLCYLPIAVGWVVIRRTRSAAVVAATFVVGLAVQGVVVRSTSDAAHAFVINRLATLRDAVGVRVFGVFLIGPTWVAQLWRTNWRLAAVGSTLVVLALAALLWPRTGRHVQVLAPLLVAYAVILFVVPVWGRGTFGLGLIEGGLDAAGSSRYDVIPVILLGSAFAVLVAPVGGSRLPRIGQVAAWLFAAQVALLTIVNFSVVQDLRSPDAPWVPKVAAIYHRSCVGVPGSRLVTIPNNSPARLRPEGWFPVTVPCSSLAP